MSSSQNIPAVIMTADSICIFIEGKPYNITTAHKNYAVIREKLKAADYDNLIDLIDLPKCLYKSLSGNITIENDNVVYKGVAIANVLVDKIFKMIEEGFSIDPMVNFLENLLENPSRTAVKELYLFLESGNLPITEDGCFLAYKKVRGDYKDCHSGTIDNSVGQKPFMLRNEVDDNRDNTCSAGLHFCSLDYLKSFGGERIMVLKINPRDVVSIPSDYNNTKGRCWTYEVVAELEEEFLKQPETAFDTTVDTRWSKTNPQFPEYDNSEVGIVNAFTVSDENGFYSNEVDPGSELDEDVAVASGYLNQPYKVRDGYKEVIDSLGRKTYRNPQGQFCSKDEATIPVKSFTQNSVGANSTIKSTFNLKNWKID